jgi:hypothetical protein
MIDILRKQVREWITHLRPETTIGPKTIANLKNIRSAILTTRSLNDQLVHIHAVKGVKAATVPTKPMTIITPEQLELVLASLPGTGVRLHIETEIKTGLRWGEPTELRPKDLNHATRVLTVSRAVVEVDPKFHPTGERSCRWMTRRPKPRRV